MPIECLDQLRFYILNCFQEYPIPAAFREFFERQVPIEGHAVSHRRHAIGFIVPEGELILAEAVKEFMPILIWDRVLHEFGPGGIGDVACKIAIIVMSARKNDLEAGGAQAVLSGRRLMPEV